MKLYNPENSISYTSLLLFVLFSGLIYLSPFFAIPACGAIVIWVIDRLQTVQSVKEAIDFFGEAETAYRNALTKEEEIASQLKEFRTELSDVKTANNLRFSSNR